MHFSAKTSLTHKEETMRIIECYIDNFGKLSDKKFEFTNGFNAILADNGYGKTTLSVFIKCMFYGMSDTKKVSLDENERKRYLPWSGAAAGGSLTFSTDGKRYRVERVFAQKASDDRFVLYDTELGRECDDFSENLGEELFGVDAESFERTLFLSEKALSPKNDNKSISAKLSELVGCDGDISSMDGALKLLEDQRKIYAKKGGSGEIADIRAELMAVNKELAEIDKCEERMKSTEDSLAKLVIKERDLREEERGVIRDRETLAQRTNAEIYKTTLTDMRTRLSASENRRSEILDFFRGEIPSVAAVDRAKMTLSDIKRLRAVISETETEEYKALKAYFADKTTPDRIEETKNTLDRVKRGGYELSSEEKRRRVLFEKRTPKKAEIEKEIAQIKAAIKKPVLPTVFIIIGMFVALTGIALGALVQPALSFITLLGVIIIGAVPVCYNTSKKNEMNKIRAKLAEISDAAGADTRDPLIIYNEMLSLLDSSESATKGDEERDRTSLSYFAFLFGEEGDPIAAVSEILAKYEKFCELSAVEKYKSERKGTAAIELRVAEESLAKFISGFKYTTENPIEEASALLAEYNRLSAEIIERHKDITNFSSNHKTEEDRLPALRTAGELEKRGNEISFLFSDISRERALLDRQYRDDSERLETRDEFLSKKCELEEKLNKYSENLEIIKLTKKYLEDARESMTTKYLGKTKDAFLKYTENISGESGEFQMDTSFGISKLEGAKTHTTEAYSRGTRDLYNLAGRFALIDSLYENETPFVILDDPFTALDDKKTKAALNLLQEFAKEKQIIYFTCSKSRA